MITKLWLVLIPYSTFLKRKLFIKNVSSFIPVNTGRKLNVHTTFRRRPVCSGIISGISIEISNHAIF